MSNVLVVAEQSQGKLKKASLHALTAAREIARCTGGKVSALVLGSGVAAVAQDLAHHGVDVKLADAPVLARYLAESYAAVVVDATRSFLQVSPFVTK